MSVVVGEIFDEISKAHGRVPMPLSVESNDVRSYLAKVENECTRELFGKIQEWHVPAPVHWLNWPLGRHDRSEFADCLVCLGGASEESIHLSVHIAYLNKGNIRLSPAGVELADVLAETSTAVRIAREAVQHRVARVNDQIICCIAYVGDLTASFAAARLHASKDPPNRLLISLAPGGNPVLATWQKPMALGSSSAAVLNETQHTALSRLHTNIELISGPPGTGKSTTIHALVTQCLMSTSAALVTAVQNRAVEALVHKFSSASTPFIVCGLRITGVANDWTLKAQVSRDPSVQAIAKWKQRCTLPSPMRELALFRLASHCAGWIQSALFWRLDSRSRENSLNLNHAKPTPRRLLRGGAKYGARS